MITEATATLNNWIIPTLNFETTDGILHDIVFTFTFTNTSTLSNVIMGIIGDSTQFPVGGNVQTKIMGNNIFCKTYTAKQDIIAEAITINGIASPAYTSGQQVFSLLIEDEIALVADKYYVATADLFYKTIVELDEFETFTVCSNGSVFSINDLNSWPIGDSNNYNERRAATLDDLFTIIDDALWIINTATYTNNSVAIIGKNNSTESFTITLSILDIEEAVTSGTTQLSFNLLLIGSN